MKGKRPPDTSLPTVFIGSSKEALLVAQVLSDALKGTANVTLWTKAFDLGETTLDALLRQTRQAHYAVLVAQGDDLSVIRGLRVVVPRDNVVLEAGMFLARFGPRRVFLVCDSTNRAKLPTDLAGVTFATYDSAAPSLKQALKPTIKQLRSAISQGRHRHDADFVGAYLAVISDEIELSHTYADIVETHLQVLTAAIDRLRVECDWERLLQLRIRVREFFEYVGRYTEGARLGVDFVLALRELGRTEDALWAEIKDVAYMLVLAGSHRAARKKLAAVIDEVRECADLPLGSREELCFYAYRYLGISYMRSDGPDLVKAEEFFRLARIEVDALSRLTDAHRARPLLARIERNIGNLLLERGDSINEVLSRYQISLTLFEDTTDIEHIAISHLAMGTALVRMQGSVDVASEHLDEAEQIFIRIGRIVGHGRALEQKAILALKEATASGDPDARRLRLQRAKRYAEHSYAIFSRMHNDRLSGKLEGMVEHIRKEISMSPPKPAR